MDLVKHLLHSGVDLLLIVDRLGKLGHFIQRAAPIVSSHSLDLQPVESGATTHSEYTVSLSA